MVKSIMNVEEVAEYLRFSVKKIYRLVETNKIPASKIGRQYRFLKEAVDDWLQGRNILLKPDWSQRLGRVLERMKARTSKADISAQDIEEELRKARLKKCENT